ncbi:MULTISPECIES: hypothetical protein [Jannaschia]|nr:MULTISPECIES: hypothetical protein [unclassified Jannaschia]
MELTSLTDLAKAAASLGAEPLMVIVCEDGVEVAGTLAHHVTLGFGTIVLALAPGVAPPAPLPDGVHLVRLDHRPEDMACACVNALLPGRPDGAWTAWAHNAEYLFTPFCETRTVGEAMTFCTEERRDAILTCIVDLYARDMDPGRNGVDTTDAWMDAAGYYALARWDDDAGEVKDRQIDIFGGLRWRFEEHIPWDRRRIDRVSMFRARKGLMLLPDHTVSDPEMCTVSAPWHHSMTACVASFRAAKALATNPGSRAAIDRLDWDGSVRFDWRAQQLMDLGLMEPGQWF